MQAEADGQRGGMHRSFKHEKIAPEKKARPRPQVCCSYPPAPAPGLSQVTEAMRRCAGPRAAAEAKAQADYRRQVAIKNGRLKKEKKERAEAAEDGDEDGEEE